MADKPSRGKTRAGTEAQLFPWEEALEAQLGRTKKRFKGLAEDPINELRNITRQYLYDPTVTPEENEQKLYELSTGFAGTTIGKFGEKILQSTTKKIMDELLAANPKLGLEEALKKAQSQAEKKLTWEREQKPELVKQYGPLVSASYKKTNPQKMQNTKDVVASRVQKARDFLAQPTDPWVPPKPNLQAFDRSLIKDALEGFPGIQQTAFPRDVPTRASTSHVEELYTDPVNRELIKGQIARGLPLGGETFYASLYPIKQAALEAGIPAEKFDQWIHSLAPASARNSIINETAVGQFLRDMNARGIPLTEENVTKEMAEFKQKYGVGLPLMPVHRQGVANVLEGGQNLRDLLIANIPTNYKIPTYGTQKAGDFGQSVVLDVHEAAGQTQGSRYHPYFSEQGGFGNTEYNAGEQGMLGIAQEMGIPGGMAQAGRWFGGGELTGLKSPRGDALDILEKQVAYTLKQQGKQPNPALIRKEILRQIETGRGHLLPWFKGEAIPDVRETGLQRKKGGLAMADGGNPGDVSGDMFKPKPLQIPSQLTDLADALKLQFEKEKRSYRKPGALSDILMRGPLAFAMGAPMDIIGLGGEALDYLQTKIPGLRKPASVMDTGPQKVPPMGYAPKVQLAPEGLYGTAAAQDLMKRAGMTTEEERPITELTTGIAAPFAVSGGVKAAKAAAPVVAKGAKALAPTLEEMLEAQIRPYQMAVAPEGKMSKEEYSRMMREKYAAQNLAKEEKKATAADLKPQEVKVPADQLGFYSPAEKAAANLKRNIGTGEAFLSDLKRAPDVGEADLIHTGLENWLKGKKTVSKQEIQDYMRQNRIGLVKEELRAGEGSAEELRFPRQGDVIDDDEYIRSVAEDYAADWDSMGWRSRDEIREEILNQHGEGERQELINSGHIDDLVNDEVNDLAYQFARDQYYDNPYYEWQNDAGYYITGNDDSGYIVRDPRGHDITPRNGAYDFETAEGAVMMNAQEQGIYAEGGTQYHDYQLEGPSSNYREHLTSLDRDKGRGDLQKEIEEVRRAMDDSLDQEQYNSLSRRYEELKDELSYHHKPYSSSHWPQDDVLSHSRTQDRKDIDGSPILHVDEMQSDWHQDGSEFGYITPQHRQDYKDLIKERGKLGADFTELRDKTIPKLKFEYKTAETLKDTNPEYENKSVAAKHRLEIAEKRAEKIADELNVINGRLADMERAVPDAPFKKNDWIENELKKLIKIAADEGKTKITMSTWQDQLRRWGTDSIAFTRFPDNTETGEKVFNVVATGRRKLKPSDLDDTITPEEIFYLNTLRNNDNVITTKSDLRNIVKRDLSSNWSNAHIDRITNKVWDQMNGLEVEGIGAVDPRKEGFKATYGKTYIDIMKKLARKYGVNTGTTPLEHGYGEIQEKPHIEINGKAAKSGKKGQPYKEGGAVHPAVDKFASSLPHPAVAQFEKKMADGGGAWSSLINGAYNTTPDVADAERTIQGPAYAEGGGVWKQLVKGAANA